MRPCMARMGKTWSTLFGAEAEALMEGRSILYVAFMVLRSLMVFFGNIQAQESCRGSNSLCCEVSIEFPGVN